MADYESQEEEMLIPKKVKAGREWFDVQVIDTMPKKGAMGGVKFESQLI